MASYRCHSHSATSAVASHAPQFIVLNGVELIPDQTGAVFWPDRQTLIVADLHFEKGSAYATRGQLLPPYDTDATLRLLSSVIDRFSPTRLICLGDSFHDGEAADRMPGHLIEKIQSITARTDVIWITGNHDPEPPTDIGGKVYEVLVDGALSFQHEASPLPVPGELSGHFHPKATVRTRARSVSARCFIADGKRLILPSFGSFTGGLNVRDPAIDSLFPAGFDIWLIGKETVHRFPRSATLPLRSGK